MPKYIYVRLEDGGRSKYFDFEADDCVTRAIAIAEKIDYMEAFRLIESQLKNGKTPHEPVKNTIAREVLKSLGWIEIRKENKKSFKLEELPQDEMIIIHTSKHMCAFLNLVTYDLFCTKSNARVYGYFIKSRPL